MVEASVAFLTFLTTTGPVGAFVAAALVGLGLLLLVLAKASGILDDRRTDRQKTDFQDRLLKALDVEAENAAALRRENAELRESVGRLTVDVGLLREQHRRVIDLLRGVIDGRVAPSAITLAEVEGRRA